MSSWAIGDNLVSGQCVPLMIGHGPGRCVSRAAGGPWLGGLAGFVRWVLPAVVAAGCQPGTRPWSLLTAEDPPAVVGPPVADTGFTPTRTLGLSTAQSFPEARIEVLLRVLHVQLPRTARAQAGGVWSQLREDVVDSQTRWLLYRNGLRAGVGLTERWDAIRDALEAVDGRRTHELPPLRTLPGVPLGLELDVTPKDQTIFFLDRDEVVSGDTWPASQRVLRVTYTLDARDIDQVLLSVVPEVRQRVGSDWLYTDSGWTAVPQRQGRAFAAAAFSVGLGRNEFLLLAPGEKADVSGLVGGAFLTDTVEDQPYDSYVFVRADVTHVPQRR